MKYFSIRNSVNFKIIGNYPQVKEYKYICDIWSDPKFIDRFEFLKINFEPITANVNLYSKAEATDLIGADAIGFSKRLLVSDKLKNILERNRKSGLQFFKTIVFRGKSEINNYWVSNTYETNLNYIDYKKSHVFLMDYFSELELLKINSFNDFSEYEKKIEAIGYPKNLMIKKISLVTNIDDNFFILRYVEGGVKYVVSEKLKKEIEDACCTGLEFQPIELSYNEWSKPNGEREKIYG